MDHQIKDAKGLSRASLKRKKKQENDVNKKKKVEEKAPDKLVIKEIKEPKNAMESSPMSVNAISSLPSFKIVDILRMDIDSVLKSKYIVSSLLAPFEYDRFFKELWGKKPLIAHLENISPSSNFLVKKKIDRLLENRLLKFGDDLDVFKIIDGRLECKNELDKHGEPMQVNRKQLQKYAENKFILKYNSLANFDDDLWSFLTLVEQEFQCPVENSMYVVPNNVTLPCQRDATEKIFILLSGSAQIELYSPISGEYDQCDYISSDALPENPYMKPSVTSGDRFYVPKGWIYSIKQTSSDDLVLFEMSLCRNSNMFELLSLLLPQALAAAAQENPSFHRPLPKDWLSYAGVAYSELSDPRRDQFAAALKEVVDKISPYAVDMVDAAADQMAKGFIAQKLPIPLTADEEKRCSAGLPNALIYPFTKLRLLRPNIARAIVEDGKVVVYHCMDNERDVVNTVVQPLEFELDDGPTIEGLLTAYPDSIMVSDLYHPSDETDDKVSIAQALFKEGFLMIDDEASLSNSKDSEDESDSDPF